VATQRHNILKSVCLGECQSKDLPSELDLSSISAGMNRLWQRSIRNIQHGEVTEFGATLVWERGRLRLTNIVQGESNTVALKTQIQRGQKFVGTFHTHPYKQGWLGIAFSGEDFATAINLRENVSIVHAGNKIAALIRTEISSRSVDSNKIVDLANELVWRYSNEKTPFAEAVQKMNIDLCVAYGLAYYLGETDGQITLRHKP
jgi:hypothetical protein